MNFEDIRKKPLPRDLLVAGPLPWPAPESALARAGFLGVVVDAPGSFRRLWARNRMCLERLFEQYRKDFLTNSETLKGKAG